MRRGRAVAAVSVAVFAVAAGAVIRGGQQGQGQTPSQFPLSNPIRERGSSVTGAYEGWYRNKDGSASLLVGYFNRNTKQQLDIPIGPNNRIEPGGPDQGQPTHFLASRQWGVFTIKVPSDFGTKKLTWTLVANGQTNNNHVSHQQGLGGRAVRGSRVEEHAAGDQIRSNGPRIYRTAFRHRCHIDNLTGSS